MKPPYNFYLKGYPEFSSKIAFINNKSNSSICIKKLYYIVSKNHDYLKDGMYLDNNNLELQKLAKDFKINKKISNDYISYIVPHIRYYTHIRIIEDSYNPQLKGENMIFYFGNSIYNKIKYHLMCHNNVNNIFNNIFNINLVKKYGFPDYSNSTFIVEKCEIYDDFDIDSEIIFNTYNSLKINRKKKMINIFKNQNI